MKGKRGFLGFIGWIVLAVIVLLVVVGGTVYFNYDEDSGLEIGAGSVQVSIDYNDSDSTEVEEPEAIVEEESDPEDNTISIINRTESNESGQNSTEPEEQMSDY